MAAGWPAEFGVTSFPSPVCGYHASQLRAAYGANGTNTGRSQTIALVEVGIEYGYLVQAAGEGAGMYFSTGDSSGASPRRPTPTRPRSAAPPWGLGKTNNRLFETGWSTQEYQLSGNGKTWADNGENGAAGEAPACSGRSRPTRKVSSPPRWPPLPVTGVAWSALSRTSAPAWTIPPARSRSAATTP